MMQDYLLPITGAYICHRKESWCRRIAIDSIIVHVTQEDCSIKKDWRGGGMTSVLRIGFRWKEPCGCLKQGVRHRVARLRAHDEDISKLPSESYHHRMCDVSFQQQMEDNCSVISLATDVLRSCVGRIAQGHYLGRTKQDCCLYLLPDLS